MLGTLPKLADKAFVLGFLLPVFLFFGCGLVLLSDIKAISSLLEKLTQQDAWAKLAYLAIFVWTLSILMMMLNRLLYRMLEGYLWPLSNIQWLKTRQLTEFDRLTEGLKKLGDEWTQAQKAGKSFERQREHDAIEMQLVGAFPTEREFVLPTRFGNAIRAFEFYSKEVYGADSIPLWPRLATVVSKESLARLEDAFTSRSPVATPIMSSAASGPSSM
jgi:hypothetical protein